MCLAEALLRIPDADTADRLIADKLGSADWQAHVGKSESLFVNASTWALLLTGRIVRPAEIARSRRRRSSRGSSSASASPSCAPRCAKRCGFSASSSSWARRSRARCAARRVARVQLFVRHARRGGADGRGREALLRGLRRRDRGRRARRGRAGSLLDAPSVSVKLSALCPRFEVAQSARAVRELGAQADGARARRARCRHRPHGRRRGSRPARAVARDLRAGLSRPAARTTTRAWVSPCRRIRSAPRACSIGSARSRAAEGARSRCASSRAPIGTARSSARRSKGSTATRCSRASATPTSRTSRARRRC